jgi:methionyl-tRNA synthetase
LALNKFFLKIMNNDSNKIFIGVAWPYVNGDQHVGHLAGYLLPADILARYFRLKGDDVLMVSGSDCFGTPITLEAMKLGVSYEEVVDIYHPKDVALFNKFNLSYNLYTKTTTENHAKVVQEVFLQLLENGFIEIKTQWQYYSVDDDKFLPDRYVEGICPYCQAGEQRGDQCEKCGKMIESGALIDPVSKITGKKVSLKESDHYYLNLSKLNNEVENFVDEHKDVWRKWVYAEAKGWIKEGLQSRAITRDIDWGVALPMDQISAEKQLQDMDKKRFYVWFDAVTGYLSAAREWSEISEPMDKIIYNKFTGQEVDWRTWWENSEAKHYYFLGQDNLVFHTLMWPAQLMGANKKYTLPYNVVTSKFMNLEGKKFSKSRNWTISPLEMANEFGVDEVRYFIASVLPENKEADFTWETFIDGVNNELIANVGNLINRTLMFYNKHFTDGNWENVKIDEDVKKVIENTFAKSGDLLQKAEIKSALSEIMSLGFFGNKYFNDSQVWVIVKEDKEKAAQYIYNLLQIIHALTVLLYPFIPDSMDKLRQMLGVPKNEMAVGDMQWKWMELKNFKVASEIKPLFAKIDKAEVLLNKK